MKFLPAAIASIALLSASSATFAYCSTDHCRPQVYRGLFLGAGGSYNNIEYDFAVNDDRSMRSCGMKLAPVFQAGYLVSFCKCPNMMFGLKGFYKYLDYELAPHSFESTQQSVGVQHEYGVLAIVGRSYCNGICYVGIGATWSDPTYGYQMTQPDVYRTVCETQSGLTLQAGVTHNLCNGWFIDFNYTYINNSRQSIDITSGSTLAITGNFCMTIQEFMLTINKAFICA